MSISKASVVGSVALSPAMRYSSFPVVFLHFCRKQDIRFKRALRCTWNVRMEGRDEE